MKNIIFDFDGVFCNSFEATVQAYMLTKQIGSEKRKEVIEDLINNRWSISRYNQKNSFSEQEWDKILLDREEELDLKLGLGISYFEGFIKEVLKKQSMAKFALVSTASQKQIDRFVSESGIKFEACYGFCKDFSKEGLTKSIMLDWKSEPEETFFITDTVRDIYEIENILPLTNIYGCAWGFQGYEVLSKKLPPSNIFCLFEDINKLF
jgi:phosphoglycolate phosphatase-like HAD superfamily hydrolase